MQTRILTGPFFVLALLLCFLLSGLGLTPARADNIRKTSVGAFTVPATGTGNPNPGSPASPYPSTINVSGLSGTVSKVKITLNGLSHIVPNDFDMLLVGPTGANLVMLSDVFGASPISNFTITLDDDASETVPTFGANSGASYKPVNNFSTFGMGNNDNWPAPAPIPSANTTFASTFNASNPNGDWKLYIVDDRVGDVGSMVSWTLDITTGVAASPTTTTVTNTDSDYVLTSIPITFTANVRKTSDNSSVGSVGTITFKDGARTLSTVAVTNGQAVYNAPGGTFSAGNRNVTAYYSGGAPAFLDSNGSSVAIVDNATTRSSNSFCNAANIAIPNPDQQLATNALGSPYASHLDVTGLSGTISKVTVSLNNLSHASPRDMDMLLVSPDGNRNLIILSDVGGASSSSSANITLDDAATGTLPSTGGLSSGTFRPTNFDSGADTFPAPAPVPSATVTLGAAFNGLNPNGVWRLYIVDDAGNVETGNLAGGWCLNFTTSGDPATVTSVTSTKPDFAIVGQAVTLTATIKRADTNAAVTTGTVTFVENGSALAGPIALNASGQASFSTSSLSVGDHIITAQYSGAPGQFNLSATDITQSIDTATTVSGLNFTNAGTIAIPLASKVNVSGSKANPYPSHITVSGVPVPVKTATVRLNNLTHASSRDIDMMLVAPDGSRNLILMSDAGGSLSPVNNATLTFDDTAASDLPTTGNLASGTFRPTNIDNGTDVFPAPAPALGGSTTFGSAFGGVTGNGVWRLYIVDDSSASLGELTSGWTLNITPDYQPSLVVTTLADENDGTSDPRVGAGTSLREAINYANTDGAASAIIFDPAVFGTRKTITLNGTVLPHLANDGALSIVAPAAGLELNGNAQSRIFYLDPGANVMLRALTLANGNGVNEGSTGGGAIVNNGGSLLVDRCTLTGNRAALGGAILSATNLSGITTTIRNSTLSGNTGTTRGGALLNNSGLTVIENSTIAGNTAPANAGGGVATSGNASFARTQVSNTIIAGNTSSDAELVNGSDAGAYVSGGYNLIGSGNATGSFGASGDQVGVADAKLDALSDKGGPTFTRALLAGSPAVNKGNPSFDGTGKTDQRGAGFPRVVGGTIDIGAFESVFPNRPPLLNNATYSTTLSVSLNQQLAGSDPDGDTLTYVKTVGTLPPGINLSSSGLLSGTPNTAGQFAFSVNVNDGKDTLTARFIIIVSSMADAIGPNVSRPALNASYTRDQLAALVYEGTIADVAAGGATPSGVSRLLFQLRRESDKTAYSGTSDGFTTNLNRGYYAAILSDAVPNTTAGARPFKRTFSTFIPPASVLTPGTYSLVIAAQDVAGNWSIEVVPINIVTAPPVSRAPQSKTSAPSAVRGGARLSGGNS